MTITNDGIYNLTMAEYLADPAILPSLNAGTITRLISQSPAHAWHAHPRLNPNYKSEESDAFDLGSAAHALLLEGDDRMQVIRADSYRTNAAKAERDEARAAGKYPVLEARYADVLAMVDVARSKIASCPDLSGIKLDDGIPESVIIWTEGDTMFRCRPDWRAHAGDVMLSYKTTAASANPAAWPRTMLGMGADIQATLEARGNLAVSGKPTKVIFLVQEVTAPYSCSLIALAPAFQAFAEEKINCAIAIWKECLRANIWPGYTSRIAWVEPPAWAIAQQEELMAGGLSIPNDEPGGLIGFDHERDPL